jgi:xylulokinase
VENPQNVGAVGAAVVMAVGLGLIKNITDADRLITIKERYLPNQKNTLIYDRFFQIFKSLYYNNKKAFRILNG